MWSKMPTDEVMHENPAKRRTEGKSSDEPTEDMDVTMTRGFSLKKSTHNLIDSYYRENRNLYRSKSHMIEVAVLEFLENREASNGPRKDIHQPRC
jgi:hypothetical protein